MYICTSSSSRTIRPERPDDVTCSGMTSKSQLYFDVTARTIHIATFETNNQTTYRTMVLGTGHHLNFLSTYQKMIIMMNSVLRHGSSAARIIFWSALTYVVFSSHVTCYTILGGIEQKTKDDSKDEDSIVTQKLRHLDQMVELRIQSHEPSGRVSMAGTLWEASPLLADYITNPACPLEAFQRMRIHEDDGNARLQPQPSTIVELGSGVGLASLAAAFIGCRVFATDGAPSSIRLMDENFQKYSSNFSVHPRAIRLDWGDVDATESLIQSELCSLPDIIMASDVVYSYSAREELAKTIRQLCPPNHTSGRVVIAHRWRTDPEDEEAFFKSFDNDFDRVEVGLEFLPDDGYHRKRSMMDMRYPISIFELKRK